MKNDDDYYIELIEPTPKLKTKKCRLIAKSIALALYATPYIITILLWYSYDLFIGIVALGLSYLIVGIIRSKLRALSIPPHQLEYNYSDMAIATWYTAKNLCFFEENDQTFSSTLSI